MKTTTKSTNGVVSSKTLKKLVDELLKSQPNQNLVKQLMKDQGLSYSVDPIIQMSVVLDSMSGINVKKESEPEVLS